MNIYKGKTVLVTGHTGFKGSWMSKWLYLMGANVYGYSLYKGYHYERCMGDWKFRKHDIRNYSEIYNGIESCKPDIVFHFAGQAIVKIANMSPETTFNTNTLGTINLLNASIKLGVRNVVVITTDKVYRPKSEPHKELDELFGVDAYSQSKVAAEYACNHFREQGLNVITVRAGNVIGGGDMAPFRLIPDLIRSRTDGPVVINTPSAIIPFQYILDCLYGYLLVGKVLLNGNYFNVPHFNFGPKKSTSVSAVCKIASECWNEIKYIDIINEPKTNPLILDASKAKYELDWEPRYSIEESVKRTIAGYKSETTVQEIKEYMEGCGWLI